MNEVVITGIGMINAVGNSARESFANICRGMTGVDTITSFDVSADPVRIAAEVKGFKPESVLDKKDIKKSGRFIHLGLHAAQEAMTDAAFGDVDKTRFGVSGATGIGGLEVIDTNAVKNMQRGHKGISPFFIPASLTNMLSGYVSIHHGLRGPNLSSTTACTAGLHAITEAAKTIMTGGADIMMALGAESCITPLGIRGFAVMKALSTRNDDPKTASRPFDKERDGFVMGEGAAALILESKEHALKRGAKIYAQIAGFGESADATHITTPAEGGEGAVRAINAALRMAGDIHIDYINAHGTSTPYNDLYETMAFKTVFGGKEKVPSMSSTKGAIGHCLGAAGAIEAVISILAMVEGIMPPTINQLVPDETCDLDTVPNTARRKELNVVMSTNYGFGGTNGAIIFKR
jgi:3-oxoacyl-[acyl-carrier-protein] synthase II